MPPGAATPWTRTSSSAWTRTRCSRPTPSATGSTSSPPTRAWPDRAASSPCAAPPSWSGCSGPSSPGGRTRRCAAAGRRCWPGPPARSATRCCTRWYVRTAGRQQAAGLLAAAVRVGWILCTTVYAALGILHFAPFWFFVPLLFIANDVKQALRIPDRDRWDVLLAALLLPQEAFAWMRACWFTAAWCEVIRGRLTGIRKDRWTMQYAAEATA